MSGHYLLSLSVDNDFGNTGSTDMSACALVNNTSQGASFRAPASTVQESKGGGGCGTIGGADGGGKGGGPGALTILLAAAGLAQAGFSLGRRFGPKLVRRRR